MLDTASHRLTRSKATFCDQVKLARAIADNSAPHGGHHVACSHYALVTSLGHPTHLPPSPQVRGLQDVFTHDAAVMQEELAHAMPVAPGPPACEALTFVERSKVMLAAMLERVSGRRLGGCMHQHRSSLIECIVQCH